MAFTYTLTELPPVWPGKRTQHHKKAPFKSQWTRTLSNLDREIRHLGGRKVEIALELPRGAFDLRQDGMLRSDARPKPAVILSFLDSEGVRHAYPCDTYGWYQDNLHAIAVVLEDLRRAERYGVQSALLRAGFKALPSQTAPTLSADRASWIIANASGGQAAQILSDREVAKERTRKALFQTHPDRNAGSREDYDLVDEARKILSSHHGVSL